MDNINKNKLVTCCELLKNSFPDENKKVPSFGEQMNKFSDLVNDLQKNNKLCNDCNREYCQPIKNVEDYVTKGDFDKFNKYFWMEEGDKKEKSSFQKRIEIIAIKHLTQLKKEVNEEAKKELGYEFAKEDIKMLLDFMKKHLNKI